jgi:hypothetical protein
LESQIEIENTVATFAARLENDLHQQESEEAEEMPEEKEAGAKKDIDQFLPQALQDI